MSDGVTLVIEKEVTVNGVTCGECGKSLEFVCSLDGWGDISIEVVPCNCNKEEEC